MHDTRPKNVLPDIMIYHSPRAHTSRTEPTPRRVPTTRIPMVRSTSSIMSDCSLRSFLYYTGCSPRALSLSHSILLFFPLPTCNRINSPCYRNYVS